MRRLRRIWSRRDERRRGQRRRVFPDSCPAGCPSEPPVAEWTPEIRRSTCTCCRRLQQPAAGLNSDWLCDLFTLIHRTVQQVPPEGTCWPLCQRRRSALFVFLSLSIPSPTARPFASPSPLAAARAADRHLSSGSSFAPRGPGGFRHLWPDINNGRHLCEV